MTLYLLMKNDRKYLIKIIEKYYFLIVFTASSSILISAYILELFFNHPPCNLCEYQRVPYFLLILISLVSVKIKKIQLKIVAFICFFSSFIISGFHSLVERKLVKFNIGGEWTVKFPVIVLLTQLPPVTIWYLYWRDDGDTIWYAVSLVFSVNSF